MENKVKSKRKKIKKSSSVCLVYSASPSQDDSIVVTINTSKSKTIFKSQKQY